MKYPKTPTSFALYVRKSSEQSDRQVLSIEAQIEELKAFADHQQLPTFQLFTDAASAHKTHNRPAFNEMMKAIEQGRVDGILAWKEDRLARNMIEGGQLIHLLQTGVLKQIRTPFTTYSPRDNTLPLTIAFGMANQYSKDLSDTVIRGMRKKAANGGFCFMAPVGYMNNKLEKTIEIDPHYFPIVKSFWKWYASQRYSLAEICHKANRRGYRSPKRGKRGDKPLSVSVLHNLLQNPFYAGLIKSGDQLIKGNHQPIVSRECFDKVQRLLKRNSTDVVRQHRIPMMYRGLFRCDDCGCAITAEKKCKYSCPNCRLPRTKKTPHNCPRCQFPISAKVISKANQYTYYHCTNAKGTCKQKSIREETLRLYIEMELEKLGITDELLSWCSKWSDHTIDQIVLKQSNQQGDTTQLVKEYEHKLATLLELRINQEVSAEEYATQKQRYQAKLDQLDQSSLSEQKVKQWKARVRRFIELRHNILDFSESLSGKNKVFQFQKLFSNPTISGGKPSLVPTEDQKRLTRAIEAGGSGLEPPKSPSTNGEGGVSEELCQEWWGLVESLRTDE